MTTARSSRDVALAALVRVESGAYANLVLPALLSECGLSKRDRAFATELTYGTARMRRACDYIVSCHLTTELDPEVRCALRLGAYQLAFLGVPAHAAVSQTVEVSPPRGRPVVNAVLRKIASGTRRTWPDEATELSYPDWIVERLAADLGRDRALAALHRMNEAPEVTDRGDGYIQDPASTWVADAVGARAGDRVVDLCAAPGGKTTALAAKRVRAPAVVVAADLNYRRARLIEANSYRLSLSNVQVMVADGRAAPLRPAAAARVLVDAPCSGLGVLGRRPDARWRIRASDVERLRELQVQLLDASVGLVAPGGVLVYSVCTMTKAETADVDEHLAAAHPDLSPLDPLGPPWERLRRGSILLPQSAGTDGMYVLRLARPSR